MFKSKGWLALAGYLVLAAMAAFALYQVDASQERTSWEICNEQNKLREAMIDVFEGQLPPLPIPEDASPNLERTIQNSNERNRRLVETFKEEMQPLDCDVVD